METLPISPIAIANYFVKKANSTGATLTPMKLLKLVYLAHGWYLGLNNGEQLIAEFPQAWKYGPVLRSVYDEFKSFKDGQITSLGFDKETQTYPMASTPEIIAFLDKIWDVYKDFSAFQLSTLTHQPESPWFTIWNQYGGKENMGAIIPNDIIADYYRRKANL